MNASPCEGRSNLALSLSHQERTISFGKETPPENIGSRNPTARAQAKDLSGVTFATCARVVVTLRGTRNRLIIISGETDVRSWVHQADGRWGRFFLVRTRKLRKFESHGLVRGRWSPAGTSSRKDESAGRLIFFLAKICGECRRTARYLTTFRTHPKGVTAVRVRARASLQCFNCARDATFVLCLTPLSSFVCH